MREANAYAEYVRKLANQQKELAEKAFRIRNVKIKKEKQRELKRKAEQARQRQASIKSAVEQQEETLAEPAKERKLSEKAKQRRAARGMRAEGDPDAWWRHLDDPDDDADAGAVAGGPRAQEQAEAEIPVYMADLLQDERVQAVIRELVSVSGKEYEPEFEPQCLGEPEPYVEGEAGSSVVA